MPDGKTLAAYLVSAAALLGPLAYILFAFHEQGRLDYFGAPIEFMQISSFGIIPVVTTIYPLLLISVMVFGLLAGVPVSAPGQQIVLIAGAVTYSALVLYYASLTPLWQWIFGLTAALGSSVALFKNRHTPGYGNEEAKQDAGPEHISLRHFAAAKRYVFIISGIAVFTMVFAAWGKKHAATQESYWISGDGVVLGFYGEQVLIGELHGIEVGPKFRFAELKSIKESMQLLQIGPLRPAPMWNRKGPGS